MIELEESDQKDASFFKWKDYEIKTLIVIRGKMHKEFARIVNKQGIKKN